MVSGQNRVKIVIVPQFDDVTVMLSLIILSRIFFTNSPWYYLTPCQNLLRLNVIFMVRKIGKKEVHGGWLPLPITLPLSNFRAKTVCQIWKIFMERCTEDETTAKKFDWNKTLPIPEKNWKNLLRGGGGIHPCLAIGGLRHHYLTEKTAD